MSRKEIFFGLMASVFLAMVLSPFASPWPDGLEKIAEDKGFMEKGDIKPVFSSPIPDYSWPHFKSEKLATSCAGAAGTLLVFGIGCGLAALIRRRQIQ